MQTDSGVVMKVLTKDGWSTRADWRFRSAGGEVEFTIGMVEDNLLGTASSASVRYRKTPDRSTVALGFRRPRLFAGRVGLAVAYENRSDGRLNFLALEQPFYSLTSSHAFRFEADDRDERVLRFFDGSAKAQDTLSRHYTLVRGSAAFALRKSSDGFLRLGFLAQVRRDDFLPEGSGLGLSPLGDRRVRPLPGLEPGQLPGHPGRLGVRPRGGRRPGHDGAGRRQSRAPGVRLRARRHRAAGHGPGGGAGSPGASAISRDWRAGCTAPRGSIRGRWSSRRPASLKPVRGHVGIVHVEAGWIENPLPGSEFDLGLGSGPRAFRSHAFTGDRSVFATAEYRVTVADDFLGLVGLGIAGFVDHGGAWYAGTPRRLGWDAGLGLRLGASRASDTEALRFDLARRFGNDAQDGGWVVTVGKGFVFSPVGQTGAVTRRRRSGSGSRATTITARIRSASASTVMPRRRTPERRIRLMATL